MPYREKLKIKVKGSKKHHPKDVQKSYEKVIKRARCHLLSRIEDFHEQGQHFLDVTIHNQQDKRNICMPEEEGEDREEDEEENLQMPHEEDEDEFEFDDFDDFEWDADDESEESDEEADAEQSDETVQPEDILLQMPSTQGRDACVASGKTDLMEQEIKLRTGQANDALSQIRLGLNYKSYLWMEYKQTDNYKMKTRSSTALRAAEQNIRLHVASYWLAYRALASLKEQGIFQPIKKGDLKVNTNIVKPNHTGQSKDTLSWIWWTGQPSKEESEDTWRQKSKIVHSTAFQN